MRFEFPRGSGQVAHYDDAEAAEMRDLIRAGEEGRISRAELERVCLLIHEAKVCADARLLSVPEQARTEEAFYVPPTGSPFQIPDAVLVELMYDGPLVEPAADAA